MTKYLNFSEDFTEKILRGEKIATLRLGLKDYRQGDIVVVRAGQRELGKARIREVHVKRFRDLTQEDVEMDGYRDREELKNVLMKFYGDFKEDQIFTQVVFELIK